MICPNISGKLIIIFGKIFPTFTFIHLHNWNKYPTYTFIISYPLITISDLRVSLLKVLNTSSCCFFRKPHNLIDKLVLLVQAVRYIHRSSCKGGSSSSSNSSKFSSHSRYFFRQNVTLCDHCDQGHYQSLLRRIVRKFS